VLDQVAAERERQLEILVRERVGEALADVRWCGAGAAVDACKRDFGWRTPGAGTRVDRSCEG
jgi:hypothetical protein